MPVRHFLAIHTSQELSELLAAEMLDTEDIKQAELNAKAQAAEEKLRKKRLSRHG